MASKQLTSYFDYKSPYAYLAQEPLLALKDELGLELSLLPYTLDIPSFLGSAEVDGGGNVTRSERNEHQWRRVRYSYMDCRREANRRGLVLRGTRKIFDSTIAHIGYLYALETGDPLDYHNTVYERFWRRELDIEDLAALEGVLAEARVPVEGFRDYAEGEGRAEHDAVNEAAFDAGVYGVPTYLVADEAWFGREHLPRVSWLLAGRPGDPPDVANRRFGA